MDGTSAVFIWETNSFSQVQGNQGIARRRTLDVTPARPQIDAGIVEKGRSRMETQLVETVSMNMCGVGLMGIISGDNDDG